jgi:hypothetical protein
MPLVIVVCRQVEVSVTGRWLVQRSPIVYDVSECDCGTSTMRRLRTTRAVELLKKMCVYNYVVPRFRPYPRNCQELQNMFYGQMVSTPRQNHKIKTLPILGGLWLLIEYIPRYFPRLDLVFFLRNLRMFHALVTGTHSTLGWLLCIQWWINGSVKLRESWLVEELFASQEGYAPKSYLFAYH